MVATWANALQEQLPSALEVWDRRDCVPQTLFNFDSSFGESLHERKLWFCQRATESQPLSAVEAPWRCAEVSLAFGLGQDESVIQMGPFDQRVVDTQAEQERLSPRSPCLMWCRTPSSSSQTSLVGSAYANLVSSDRWNLHQIREHGTPIHVVIRSHAIDGGHGEGRVRVCQSSDHVAHTIRACSG